MRGFFINGETPADAQYCEFRRVVQRLVPSQWVLHIFGLADSREQLTFATYAHVGAIRVTIV